MIGGDPAGGDDGYTTAPVWRKSSYSQEPPECVEVARGRGGEVLIRDSTHPDGAVIQVPARAWREFLLAVDRDTTGVR